jgi:hypothetical protein
LKISPLLSQYFFTNKQLSLSGIGRFILEEPGFVIEEPGKSSKSVITGNIRFEQDPTTGEDAELVIFIAQQSGKMKSLAAADLDSNLELARQFLNIGKPFTIEGIGTLTKNKTGKLEFTQTSSALEKGKEQGGEGKDITSTTEDSFTDYQEMFSPKKHNIPASKRIVTWVIILAGLSLAVFGGYLVYNNTKKKVKESPVVTPKETLPDTSNKTAILTPPVSQTIDSTNFYRFVIENAGRTRAMQRFTDLRSYGHDIRMETKDSVRFKLFYLLKVNPSDTARIRDSLTLNYGRGKTLIESN